MVEKLINNTLTSTKDFEDLYPFDSNFMIINGNDLHYIDKGKGIRYFEVIRGVKIRYVYYSVGKKYKYI